MAEEGELIDPNNPGNQGDQTNEGEGSGDDGGATTPDSGSNEGSDQGSERSPTDQNTGHDGFIWEH